MGEGKTSAHRDDVAINGRPDAIRTSAAINAYVPESFSSTGGAGDQAAAVYRGGSLAYAVGIVDLDDPPHRGFGNINGALRLLGAELQDGCYDELEAVGLHHHRSVPTPA